MSSEYIRFDVSWDKDKTARVDLPAIPEVGQVIHVQDRLHSDEGTKVWIDQIVWRSDNRMVSARGQEEEQSYPLLKCSERRIDLKGRDPLLTVFLGMAEDGTEFGVTLVVGGQWLTGTLISQKKYTGLLVGSIEKAIGASLGSAFSALEQLPPDEFVHLTGARLFTGATALPTDGGLWRGRVAEVQGFTLGTLGSPTT